MSTERVAIVKDILEADRPSRHGQILGSALSLIAMAGRKDSPVELPEMCATCAFREGTAPNMCAGTGLMALNIVLGIDRDRFSCHHGMKDGVPQKLCAGYIAAKIAPFSFTRDVLEAMMGALDRMEGDDEVRAKFDEWVTTLDQDQQQDVYAIARKFERFKRTPIKSEDPS